MKSGDKKLIFLNLINGVHIPYVAAAFHASPEEIIKIFEFCLGKIKSYAIAHHRPPVIVGNLKQAIEKKILLSQLAEEIKNWDKDPVFINIEHTIMTPDQFHNKVRTQ